MEPQNDHNHNHHNGRPGRRNKIAWIALAVGLLALGFAIGSRSGAGMGWQGQRGQMMGWQQAGPGPAQWQQGQMPNMPQPPQAAQPPQNQVGPRGPMMGWQEGSRGRMMHQRGPGGFFGLIFGIISGLFKLAFWGIALFLIVKVLRDRRNDPGGKGGDQTASRPGPEQPPYTGHTTNL
ncbi:MAG: hypothetical protein SH847_05555 [Roseiflexaceae bacterium]|nr:hypothetical protein [Roseiflexaceae bacterium]